MTDAIGDMAEIVDVTASNYGAELGAVVVVP